MLLLLAVAGCQARSGDAPERSAPPVAIELREPSTSGSAGSTLVASVRPGRPCRATIDGTELTVGGPPLDALAGSAHWTGEDRDRSTLISRDGTAVARLLDNGDDVSVVDPQGIPLVRIIANGSAATVANREGRLIRRVVAQASAIAVEGTPTTAYGTKDLVVVALLSASELPPELRMLAACRRVLREVH